MNKPKIYGIGIIKNFNYMTILEKALQKYLSNNKVIPYNS